MQSSNARRGVPLTHAIDLDAVFAVLPPDVRHRLRAMAAERRLARGHVLFRAGDDADGLYVVLAGRLRVSRETPHQVEMLHTESPGGILGEIPVFGGGAFPSTAVATEPSICAKLPRSGIERLLGDSPAFSRFALQRLATRAQSLLTRIDELTALTITTRVAHHVLGRAARSREFTLGMSQLALAEELGTAREVVVRAIRELVRTGALCRVGRSRFVVSDRAALESAAGPSSEAVHATGPATQTRITPRLPPANSSASSPSPTPDTPNETPRSPLSPPAPRRD